MSTLHDEFETLDHDDLEAELEQEEREKLERLRREKVQAEDAARAWWEEAKKTADINATAEQRENYNFFMNEAVLAERNAEKARFAYEVQKKILQKLVKDHEAARKFRDEQKKIADDLPSMEKIEEQEKEEEMYPPYEVIEEQQRENERKKRQRADAMTEDEFADMLPDDEKPEEKAASEEDPDKNLSKAEKEEKYAKINRQMEPIIQNQFDKINSLYMSHDEKTGKETGLAQNFKVFEESKDKHGSAEFKEMYDALAALNPAESIKDMYNDVLGPKHDYSGIQKLREQISKAYEKTQNYVAMKDSSKTKWSLGKGKTYLKEAQDALQRLGDMWDCIDTITLNRNRLQETADYRYSTPDKENISLKDLQAMEVVTRDRRKAETLKKTKERQKGTKVKTADNQKNLSSDVKKPSRKK